MFLYKSRFAVVSKILRLLGYAAVLCLVATLLATRVTAQELSQQVELHPNDVSILYPLPESIDEFSGLISIAGLTSELDDSPVFPEADFTTILTIAQEKGRVDRRGIDFHPSNLSIDAWKIAGVRFDPAAPGASAEVAQAFGSIPQIRLVVQPVTLFGGQIRVHDVALHVIYSYPIPPTAEQPLPQADSAKVNAMISDLLAMRAVCEDEGGDTSGALSVHPCLQEPMSDFHVEVVGFLRKYLHAARFQVGAIMGLNNGAFEPWIFVALQRNSQNGEFAAFPSPGLDAVSRAPTAQMVSFIDFPRVQPVPSTTNTLDITANLEIPISERRGVSTAPLFESVNMDDFALIGQDAQGSPVLSDTLRNTDIVDWIAHPARAHFFNTDCVSCHSETTLRESRRIPPSEFAFVPEHADMTVDPAMLHANQWNVRNFGWFVDPRFGTKHTTITMRTANETFEVVEATNKIIQEQGLQASQE